MKLFRHSVQKYESGWSGEIRFFDVLYFALVINYIFGTRINLSVGIYKYEIGLVITNWDKFQIDYNHYENED